MNKLMELECSRIVSVLEETVSSLGLMATVPECFSPTSELGVTRKEANEILPDQIMKALDHHVRWLLISQVFVALSTVY
jgi:hypothetical protein